jgi:hypothetical protein
MNKQERSQRIKDVIFEVVGEEGSVHEHAVIIKAVYDYLTAEFFNGKGITSSAYDGNGRMTDSSPQAQIASAINQLVDEHNFDITWPDRKLRVKTRVRL